MKVKPDHEPDIRLFLDHFEPPEEEVQARHELLDHLIEILSERFGPGFDVEYVGIGRYAASIKQAPFEVAIVDVQSELGIASRDYASDLPDIYSPLAVARALTREGFRVRIDNHSLSRTTTARLPIAREYVHPQPDKIEDQEWHWFNRRGLIYPERLHIGYPVAFELILPGPAAVPLVHMLEEYSKLVPPFRDLVSISYIWCRSLGMNEISPTCLALLFVSFLQETAGMPGITFSTSSIADYDSKQYHLSKIGCKWAVHEISLGSDQWKDEIVALETDFSIQDSPEYTESDKSRLLRDFINFLGRTSKNSRAFIISVGTGKKISRDSAPYLGSTIKSLPNLLSKLADTPYASMQPPQLWKIHPLIVQDPFMYTHNHAEFVSCRTVDALAHNSRVAIGKIDSGCSLIEILGIETAGPASGLQRALTFQDEENSIKPHVRLARSATIRKVQDMVRQVYGKEYRVELFGSTSYGVDNPTSDLDLVILDANRMDGFSPSLDLTRLPPVYDVRALARALWRAGFENIFPIPSASVPIVKFRDPHTGLECDINVNDQLGFINTSMIRHYVSLQPVLIPLLRLIKRWAKGVGLNFPSKRPVSFSSYTLTLMTIAWFQSLGWLPNLQRDISTNSDSPADYFWIKNRKLERFRCDTRFKKAEDWERVNVGKAAGELFFEWLGFWGWKFDYAGTVACMRRGGIVPRKGKSTPQNPNPAASTSGQIELELLLLDDEQDETDEEVVLDESFDADWSRNFMCVADPFVVAKNCAGQIKKFIFTRFIHECRNTEGMLQLGISLESILSRDPPAWQNPPPRPKKVKKGKKKTKKDQDKQAQEKRVPTEKPKPRPRPEPSHSGVQGGSSNTTRNGRGRKRVAPPRIQANNS